ncbi:Protein-lysine N-methyltransferase EFM6 [Sparassis crispa]|uniref:Protein-lysine N-methyltransferase EFM6 n=1 Tax=Sparassis crispa TaxID=139825 RepID=A0A401GAK5_9APHY|nr:Protein-lysine N-methyltransferase EFM6 [Sparassis crispa]GBE79189.1 Protein-lysine N-methyltransferase EFM6 [Sparassis crispa]
MIDLILEEKLDELDPLRHLRNDDDAQLADVVPAQPPSIHNQLVELSFSSDESALLPNPVVIKLVVDASPGCGGIAWPAGEVLAAYIARRGSWKGKNVLELGSGTGLVGLVAGKLGARACITDQAPLIEIMARNVSMNDLTAFVTVAELNWGEPIPQDIPRPDVLLAADCVYFEPAFPLLVKTLADLVIDDTTEVLFCYKKRRKADKRFFTLLKKEFTWTEVDDNPARDAYSREAISLLRLSRKHSRLSCRTVTSRCR